MANPEAAELTRALLGCDYSHPVSFPHLQTDYVGHYIKTNLSDYVITRLDLCKEKRSPYHEYVLAHVSRREGPSARPCGILRAERSMPSQKLDESALRLASTLSAQVSLPLPSLDMPATDHVKICGPAEFDEGHILYHAFKTEAEKPWAIHEFIAAGLAIGQYKPNYNIMLEQCYWFAGLVFRLLVGEDAMRFEATGATVKRMNLKDKEKSRWKWVRRTKPGKFGELFQLVTSKQLREELRALEPRFSTWVEDLAASVHLEEAQRKEIEEMQRKIERLEALVATTPAVDDEKSHSEQSSQRKREKSEADFACTPPPSPPPSYWTHGLDPRNASPLTKDSNMQRYTAGRKLPHYGTGLQY
ncbi:hypothetical protein L226DRAFT_609988 [Lentinus tigrinus ALCF2SS1-7]|uniref:Uncharacterized protein n=1 Tax=Lentinus tigrinus ALCF2SS1-6 TaxID=1328759 RepID=A0A5C2RZM9_9APHY|nr:hypothetical protein L227DRAFT_614395 [Lentinus tigrinus ALCF2SS1-6]RPD79583.1 hypothetical protein L226DRAFT_609988 [Lentinus tigrinus ALCF2SS1-7]